MRPVTRQEYPLHVTRTVFGRVLVERIGDYVADFDYLRGWRDESEDHVTEDCKGFRTPLYRWKKKHFEAQYGRKILET